MKKYFTSFPHVLFNAVKLWFRFNNTLMVLYLLLCCFYGRNPQSIHKPADDDNNMRGMCRGYVDITMTIETPPSFVIISFTSKLRKQIKNNGECSLWKRKESV